MITAEKVISAFKTKYPVVRYQDFYLAGKNYLNIRSKSEASYHRKTKRYEFGMPRRDYDRYLRMVKEGRQVYSLIIESKSDTLYIAKLSDLAAYARMYDGDKVDKGGSVFLPRDRYRKVEV